MKLNLIVSLFAIASASVSAMDFTPVNIVQRENPSSLNKSITAMSAAMPEDNTLSTKDEEYPEPTYTEWEDLGTWTYRSQLAGKDFPTKVRTRTYEPGTEYWEMDPGAREYEFVNEYFGTVLAWSDEKYPCELSLSGPESSFIKVAEEYGDYYLIFNPTNYGIYGGQDGSVGIPSLIGCPASRIFSISVRKYSTNENPGLDDILSNIAYDYLFAPDYLDCKIKTDLNTEITDTDYATLNVTVGKDVAYMEYVVFKGLLSSYNLPQIFYNPNYEYGFIGNEGLVPCTLEFPEPKRVPADGIIKEKLDKGLGAYTVGIFAFDKDGNIVDIYHEVVFNHHDNWTAYANAKLTWSNPDFQQEDIQAKFFNDWSLAERKVVIEKNSDGTYYRIVNAFGTGADDDCLYLCSPEEGYVFMDLQHVPAHYSYVVNEFDGSKTLRDDSYITIGASSRCYNLGIPDVDYKNNYDIIKIDSHTSGSLFFNYGGCIRNGLGMLYINSSFDFNLALEDYVDVYFSGKKLIVDFDKETISKIELTTDNSLNSLSTSGESISAFTIAEAFNLSQRDFKVNVKAFDASGYVVKSFTESLTLPQCVLRRFIGTASIEWTDDYGIVQSESMVYSDIENVNLISVIEPLKGIANDCGLGYEDGDSLDLYYDEPNQSMEVISWEEPVTFTGNGFENCPVIAYGYNEETGNIFYMVNSVFKCEDSTIDMPIYLIIYTPKGLYGLVKGHLKITLPELTGVENVDFDGSNGEIQPLYFDLQGHRVSNPVNGLFIKVDGTKAQKVYIK